MIKSVPSSSVALASYFAATVFVIGGMFILAVVGGRELKTRHWLHEEATVLNTFSLCRMVDGKPGRKGRPRYIETIECEQVDAYLALHEAEYDYLRPDEVEYASLGYRSLGLNSKAIKIRDISRSRTPRIGQRFEILVNAKHPLRIDRLPVAGEFKEYVSYLAMFTAFTFFLSWGRMTLDERWLAK